MDFRLPEVLLADFSLSGLFSAPWTAPEPKTLYNHQNTNKMAPSPCY